jgi:hypothetical protein
MPGVIVPAHCTGWRAQDAMSARFGEASVPNTVGTRFQLGPIVGASLERRAHCRRYALMTWVRQCRWWWYGSG